MEHFFSPNSSGEIGSDARQSQIIGGGDADVDHIQIIEGDTVKLLGGIYPPQVSAPMQWRIQKILVGGDLKHKTSKIRMSSPKLRVIFRPKSEIQTFFSPKFRWSPKKKKKKGLHQN